MEYIEWSHRVSQRTSVGTAKRKIHSCAKTMIVDDDLFSSDTTTREDETEELMRATIRRVDFSSDDRHTALVLRQHAGDSQP